MTREEKCVYLIDKGYTYNPQTGEVKNPKGKVLKRKTLGYYSINIFIDGKHYDLKQHQFAWYYVYGECVEMLDHINRNRDDNRISNLRITNHMLNGYNRNPKGYFFRKDRNRWVGQIVVNGNTIRLGSYKTEEEARQSYLDGKKKYHIV